MGEELKIDSRNKLNTLTGRQWIRFTKSWYIADGKPSDISHEIELHPASFPPPMIREFIEFFTKPGDRVLDPFLGTGSTLVACDECGRQGVGIELYEKYVKTAQARTKLLIHQGDARKIVKQLNSKKERFSLCITSPPYWRILKKKKDYNQQERLQKGLDLQYGEHPSDLGMIEDQSTFLSELVTFFKQIKSLLFEEGHLVIFVQNVRDKGEMNPLAFNLALELSKNYKFLGERIWLQNQKTLRPYGYPYSFVPNIHHHYALIFKKK